MYNYDEDVHSKVNRFHNTCRTISRTLEQKVLAIYKVAAVPILLHGSEPYTVKIKD
jgi:hypothetical protein